ncbi:MAG: FeoC-like transcriptional regulator [Cyanobacteria bacterium P01_G01_bin.39]
MNIKELKDFVFDFGRVSLAEMKLYLQIDRETLNPMLDSLVQQGIVKKSYTAKECQTCQKCDPEEIEFYEWSESA